MLAYTHEDVFDYNFRFTVCRSNFLSMLKFWICLETVINTLTFCLPQGHMNIVEVVFKSVCVCVCGDAKKSTELQQRMVNSVLCGPGWNVSSPQTVACPLQEKSPVSCCCLEILAHVEVYRIFYPVNRGIFSQSLQSVVTFEISVLEGYCCALPLADWC